MKNPENRKWTVLRSEYLARKPWFTVRHESIGLPDGRCIPDYYVLEYPDWVNVIALTREGRFVMIDQYRHGPAGVLDPTDASTLAGAQRELMEETGYGGGRWRLLTVLSANPATHNNLTHCYLAEDVELLGAQHLDATEDLRVHLLTRDQVQELLRTDRIRQALMAAPLWRYFCETGDGNDGTAGGTNGNGPDNGRGGR